MRIKCLSIVSPNGSNIIQGNKKLEIRRWIPQRKKVTNLFIIENKNYLSKEYCEEMGTAIGIVDVIGFHVWMENEIDIACARNWEPGYFAWELDNVRVIEPIPIIAKLKLYNTEINENQVNYINKN